MISAHGAQHDTNLHIGRKAGSTGNQCMHLATQLYGTFLEILCLRKIDAMF